MTKRNVQHNVYSGTTAIKDFLNPSKNPYLPMVELPPELNPYYADGVRIYAKLMNMLPLSNVKSLPALNMLEKAKSSGRLRGVKSIIENSSGNTVFSLTVLARHFGISDTTAIVSDEVSGGKLDLLRFFGTNIVVNEEPICPDPSDATSGIYKAKQIGARKGWFNPAQYDNPANPQAHERWTGKQVWEQTNGAITLFCAGMGTTGTLVGTAQYLKRKNKNVKTVGVVRAANNPVPGVRTKNLLREIAFNWKGVVDMVEQVGTKEAFERSLKLCRAGIVVGPSSGFAFQGLLQSLESLKLQGFKGVKGKSKKIVAVFVCPDSPLPYLHEYFEYLDDKHFGSIKNAHLLSKSVAVSKKRDFSEPTNNKILIEPLRAFSEIYEDDIPGVWKRLKSGAPVILRKNVKIVDIRPREDFDHFHLPLAESYPHTEALCIPKKDLKNKKVFLVCPMGIKTKAIALLLREKGIEAYSVAGGLTTWSELDLPRWRPDVCVVKDR